MLRHFTIITALFLLYHATNAQSISINNNGELPDNSAILDVQSTSQGMLIPRMSKSQRQDISTPAPGLVVFDTNFNSFWFWSGSDWVEVLDGFTTLIRDDDNDTKVEVEKTPDADEVLFTVRGNSVAVLDQSTLKIESNGNGTAPQINITETQTGDFARLNLENTGIDERWTLSARNSADSSLSTFNVFNSNFGGNVMSFRGDGRVGIGTSSPDSRLNVRATTGQNPMRLRINGSTKFLAHNNGGTAIGLNTTPPANGLFINGSVRLNGPEIYAPNSLVVRSDTRIELVAGSSKIIIDPVTGISIESNAKIDILTDDELTIDSEILTASINSPSTITCAQELTIASTTKDVIIDADDNITLTSGLETSFTSTNGNISAIADGILSLSSGAEMTLSSDNNLLLTSLKRVDIDSDLDMEFTSKDFDLIASGILTLNASNDLNLTAGLSMDIDAGTIISLDGSTTWIQTAAGGIFPALNSSSLTNTPCGTQGCTTTTISTLSSRVFIGL